jgi:alkanesulfonate monooxygenase SsuD/methylene tetrahydromethanopterin reductase-like flavin-dependent oxidoreductase (luciferase family)
MARHGYGFPEIPERMRMFREACEVVTRMWTEEKATFHGKHYSIDGAINEPKGVQSPRIPLWLGGGGEQVTLKLVAKYGTGSNFGGGQLEMVQQKLEVLKQHCDAAGRDIDEITRSTSMNVVLLNPGDDPAKATEKIRGNVSLEAYTRDAFVGTAAQLTDHIGRLIDLGVNYLITYFPRVAYDDSILPRFAEGIMTHFTA